MRGLCMQIPARRFLGKSIPPTPQVANYAKRAVKPLSYLYPFLSPAATTQYEFRKFVCHAGSCLAWRYHGHAALTAENHL